MSAYRKIERRRLSGASLALSVTLLLFTSMTTSTVGATTQTEQLPEGNEGIASEFPGDRGIDAHESVVFVETFESRDLEELSMRWESVQRDDIMSLSADVPAHSDGSQSLLVSHVGGDGNGATLYRRFDESYDELFYRFYVKFDRECHPIHHFFHVGGYHPSTPWPQGGAGQRPNGDERMTVGVEPFGERWTWDTYCYWMEMRGSPPRGQTWGNAFIQDPDLRVVRDRWICVELMIRLNEIGESNGELALWIDGKLVGHLGEGFPNGKWTFDRFLTNQGGEGIRWNDETGRREPLDFPEGGAPFEGFRWRNDEDLQLNFLWLLCYITTAPDDHVSKIYFDHVVVAEQYIGPIQAESPPNSELPIEPTEKCSANPGGATSDDSLSSGEFRWKVSEPLITSEGANLPESPDQPWLAVKDPTVVRHDNRWHLFCTLRKRPDGMGGPPGYIRIGHLSFDDWSEADDAKWTLLELSPDYHAAPQVFFFRPHNIWYLVYQLADESRGIEFGPCFSTTDDINDPSSWTPPQPMYESKPGHVSGWLDFWVICDESSAHLFFTSLNGRMWRAETSIETFPHGFDDPEVVLRDDIFEASHTYRIQGEDRYLTIIEAQGRSGGRGRRYFKAYVADSLDGEWQALATEGELPFAGGANVDLENVDWTDSISHGELIRASHHEGLEIDPADVRMLFQGAKDRAWQEGYGGLDWKLGLLELVDQ